MAPEKELYVDIDRDRIREIVSEALRMIHEYVGGDFILSREEVMEKLEVILKNKRIGSMQFFLPLGSHKIPDMQLRVDPRRKEVLCKSGFKRKVIKINRFLRAL
ncbi:MAG: hypothetical protein GF334_06270 [Candidatus Altiarchaeales archaeon]|nr:hypothetical protein [Candidatus Altiarchaeales archaeon]